MYGRTRWTWRGVPVVFERNRVPARNVVFLSLNFDEKFLRLSGKKDRIITRINNRNMYVRMHERLRNYRGMRLCVWISLQ